MSGNTADKDWRQVRAIFDDALRQKPEERHGFVRRACGEDASLFAEVQSLLDSLNNAEDFLETPAVVHVAGEIFSKSDRFSGGQVLGHYEIREQIGAGGMGEVYLAQDLKLNRRVAIKILREHQPVGKEANRQLLREAQAAAQLEHPNICPIYEIAETAECSFIVMQYVTGKTLAALLAKERLSCAAALDLAIQIADALAEAHARGVIHRDIKPANIVVSEKGQAKILDFGLAKFIEPDSLAAQTASRSSSSDAVLGTVPFMSPEQLRGNRLDARTDVFSFGALFYEILAGKAVFARESDAETITAILKEEPDWQRIPPKFQPVLRRSLMKNKEERYKSAQELLADLRTLRKNDESGEQKQAETAAATTPNEQAATNEPPPTKKRHFRQNSTGESLISETGEADDNQTAERNAARFNVLIPASFLIFFFLAGAFLLIYRQFGKENDSNNFDALRPVRLAWWKSGAGSNDSEYSISHDGRMIAYSSSQHGTDEVIYIKQTTGGGSEFRVTKDNWRNLSPVWSPDDQQIAFVSVRENEPGIYVTATLGGATTPLKITERANLTLRHWTKDGAAIFYENAGNLFRLDLRTRETAQITAFADSPTGNDRYFALSPDEKQIVFCDKRDGQIDVWTMPLAGGEPVRLTNDKDEELRPRWHPDGERIFYNVYRDDFCQINLVYTDGRAPAQITRGEGNYELVDVSGDGAKIYYTSWEKKSDIGAVRVETGEEYEVAADVESELWAAPAPDGKSIVYQTNPSANLSSHLTRSNLVVKTTGNQTAQIFGKGYNPRWLADSRRIAFLRWNEVGQKNEFWLLNTVNRQEKILTGDDVIPPSTGLLPVARGEIGEFDFSADGARFVYLDNAKPRNVKLGSIDSAETANLTNNENRNLQYFSPLFSPDEKLVAFVSVERFSDKAQKPSWRLWIFDGEKAKEIFSVNASLRLVGWSLSSGEIFVETTEGVMKTTPSDARLIQIPVSGAKSRTIADLEKIYAKSMTLAPDSKTAAFVARRNDKDDIWIVRTSDGETRKITANAGTRLFYANLAFSPDGKTIYFDKQEQINAISAFENFK